MQGNQVEQHCVLEKFLCLGICVCSPILGQYLWPFCVIFRPGTYMYSCTLSSSYMFLLQGHLLKLQMGRLFNTDLWLQRHPDPGRMALHEVEKGKYKETADKIEQKLNGGF